MNLHFINLWRWEAGSLSFSLFNLWYSRRSQCVHFYGMAIFNFGLELQVFFS
jgi:hypothetical protein